MRYGEYRLDPFQEEACRAVDAGDSVIVSAPTGAGKTVIAEYAAERCHRLGKRAIYTAPIKALSNQKYRDFRAAFGDENVGIVTGDVVLNPHAPLLAMTTEIFRNAVFENARQLRDVECVIFDEIHFINDIERGTVWEESIIFAPQDMQIVCLSATIPNLEQFAGWIQSARDLPLRVVSETNRPVPLEHVVYIPNQGAGSMEDLKRETEKARRKSKGRRQRYSSDFDTAQLVDNLREHDRLPALYFCFSRKGCEERARRFQSEGSFLTPEQSREMLKAYDELCAMFSIADDARADQFRSLLARGIAYHHAGMLPTLKEAVERLFTRGMVRLLFTTETFAVGINMPARSVVFESLQKYDGVSVRPLKALEYQQMAGRAGRRGIDAKGYVYASVNPGAVDFSAVQHTLTGKPEPIESQFNLSYSSILNLLEQYGDMIFEVAEQSFSNYQNASVAQEFGRQLQAVEEERRAAPTLECKFGHDPVQAIEQYREIHHGVGEKLRGMNSLRRDAKRRYRGRDGRQRRDRALKRLKRAEALAKKAYQDALCRGCQYLDGCQIAFSAHKRIGAKADSLKERMDKAAGRQRKQIESRLRVLETLGYVDGVEELPRGEIAKRVYGYEMQVTQLLLAGFFERADPDAMNALAVAMCFESKRDAWFRRPSSTAGGRSVLNMLKAASKEIDKIRAVEETHGVEPLSQPMDVKLTSAVLAWSQGCAFEELADHTSSSEGDIVRAFRRGSDLLRQMRRAADEHPTLPDKLNEAARRLNRDVVNAEQQLRAGG